MRVRANTPVRFKLDGHSLWGFHSGVEWNGSPLILVSAYELKRGEALGLWLVDLWRDGDGVPRCSYWLPDFEEAPDLWSWAGEFRPSTIRRDDGWETLWALDGFSIEEWEVVHD